MCRPRRIHRRGFFVACVRMCYGHGAELCRLPGEFHRPRELRREVCNSDQAVRQVFSFDSLPLDSLERTKEELEENFLKRALLKAGGNQREAAKLMGLTYDQFRGLYRKHSKLQGQAFLTS